MNLTDPRYADFALVREMLETPELIRRYDFETAREIAESVRQTGRLFLTGEGSSRIFPAKNLMYEVYQNGVSFTVATEGSMQALEYDLAAWTVCGGSNSGQTKELALLFTKLQEAGHSRRFAVTANTGTLIETLSNRTIILGCGKEAAVAATKSVVEQALAYRSIIAGLRETRYAAPHYAAQYDAASQQQAGQRAAEVLTAAVDASLIDKVAAAPMVYVAGRNNGVAEELTLKGNEIVRKKFDFLEGTYIFHGVEETMDPGEVVILVEPFPSESAAIKKNLVDTIGMTVIAIATEETPFPTIRIPSLRGYDGFFQLFAGWNLLVDTGIALGIDLDKPKRARKVGNACG